MANVPSVDNNLPIIQAGKEPAAGTDNEAVVPFGQFLAQESEPEPTHRPIQFKEQANKENEEQAPAKKNKQLFAEKLAKPARKLRSLFKSKTAASAQPEQAVAGKSKASKAKAGVTKTAATGIAAQTASTVRTTAKSVAFKASGKSLSASTGAPQLQTGKAVLTTASKTNGTALSTTSTRSKSGQATQPVKGQPIELPTASAARNAAASATTKPDTLTQLKTDVKAIFNSLTPLKTSSSSQTTNLRAFNQPKQPTVTLSTDRVKPIRLTSSPVIKESASKDGKTTLAHLKARKSTRLDTKGNDQQADTRVIIRDTESKGESLTQKATAGAKKAGNMAAQVSAANEGLEKPIRMSKKARLRSQKKAQRIAQARQQQAPVAGQETPGVFKDVEAMRETMQTQQATLQAQTTDSSQTDASSADSNANNLMGRSEAAAQLANTKSTGKATQAYASRSLSWLKALADRTGQMSRQDPSWKVLEMKLDRGDGQMTIQVSREDDHVSIAVQFSDDAVRAQAESQSAHIRESLKEQYGEDVAFSFTNQQKSDFSSSMDERASRRRRLRADVIAQEKAVQTQTYARSNPDQHIWIG
ncbi:MAG: hypothetical protein AAF564_12150 [Bacteroidota bacterium]